MDEAGGGGGGGAKGEGAELSDADTPDGRSAAAHMTSVAVGTAASQREMCVHVSVVCCLCLLSLWRGVVW